MFERVLIANRGIVALRVIRACRELGVTSVLAVSDADVHSLPALFADETVCIGPARPSESYLRVESVLMAASGTHVDAIHPGYGFLSEDSRLADGCQEIGLSFIGPPGEVLARAGNKTRAREAAAGAGVPVLPGCPLPLDGVSKDFAQSLSSDIGFPLLVKAVQGGGGRGMRLVAKPEELPELAASAAAEALAAFGDPSLYVERFIAEARHIEVQIVGFGEERAVHLWDRDCSVQRRHQKLIEEGPAPNLPSAVRESLLTSALKVSRALKYENVGTVEYIYDPATQQFFFLEINGRLQVEHGVTELITGVDLVRAQFQIAANENVPQLDLIESPVGCAIECRINAEDVESGFRPSPGLIRKWEPPVMGGIRLDSHCFAGYLVSPYYDSLIAKVIGFGPDRGAAIETTQRALASLKIEGIKTTKDYALRLMQSDEFRDFKIHTRWVDESLSGLP